LNFDTGVDAEAGKVEWKEVNDGRYSSMTVSNEGWLWGVKHALVYYQFGINGQRFSDRTGQRLTHSAGAIRVAGD
jgi:hypothetical protein